LGDDLNHRSGPFNHEQIRKHQKSPVEARRVERATCPFRWATSLAEWSELTELGCAVVDFKGPPIPSPMAEFRAFPFCVMSLPKCSNPRGA